MDKKVVEDRLFIEQSDNRVKAMHDPSKARITTQPILQTPPEAVDIHAILTKVPHNTLGLFIINAGDLMLIEETEKIILGRHTQESGTTVFVDLTPYGGEQSGISRRHASILSYQDMHHLQDLGSTNGTWLNAVRLPPNSSHMLKNGDMIQLGQVKIQVVFHSLTNKQMSGGQRDNE
ncbi:MAG: FHA domain-containing protein [Anaerolineae bacterium]|nr:FHA domain-containing protein [Anaerolineae bacterium]